MRHKTSPTRADAHAPRADAQQHGSTSVSALLRVPVALVQASAARLPCLREACSPGLASPQRCCHVPYRLFMSAPPPGLLSGL